MRHSSILRVVFLLTVLAFPALFVRAGEDDAVQVFKLVAPRVVALQNAEGSGTGIILRPDGLILTNAHVVSSPLPYSVTVDSLVAGKSKPFTFKKVTIVGFHPTLDLALVKIDPKENNILLPPVELAKVKGDPGERIYAIGNPAAGGHVLSKSITSGMLSAVDREVEGADYYQIDAAVNPGNSGGPICDHLGKVLGLVTFKFEDVQAISFAIPLDTLDIKAFLPLSQRKGNPAKASEYLKRASRFGELGDKTGKIKGPDSDERMLMNYYAAVCYRMALMEDPSNPAIMYNIGMMLRTLDEDAVAAAYLARGLQLGPWDITNGDQFRELGFALAKQKMDADCLVVWKEGLARMPYAGKIYEDLAIFYVLHNQPAEAAYNATVAVAMPDKDVRRAVMQNVQRESRAKMDQAAIAKLDAGTEHTQLVKTLALAMDISNQTRKARKLAVDPAFTALLEKLVGPAPLGVAEHISQTPIQPPPGFTK